MVEMDVGIIAASLVVMRPCFQFLYNIATGRSNADLLVSTRTGGGYSNSKLSSFGGTGTHMSRRDRKMSRAMDIEMESRLVASRGGSMSGGGVGVVAEERESFGSGAGQAVEYEVLEFHGKERRN